MIQPRQIVRLLGLYLCILSSSTFGGEDAPVVVSGAWIRAAPPGSTVLAGYLIITNQTNKPIRIKRLESSLFGSIEIHRSTIEQGVARMAKQEKVVVPAGKQIIFRPGGLHMMLMAPRRTLGQGEHVDLRLHITGHPALAITAEVRRDD